jgi:hypothetical protein
MKKILLLLFLIPIISKAQLCQTSKDPKTGEVSKMGFAFLKNKGNVVFLTSGNEKYLNFVQTFLSKNPQYDTENLILIIKFANDEIKTFAASGLANIYQAPNGITIDLTIVLKDSDSVYLLHNPTTLFRVCYKGDEDKGYDTPITVDDASAIMKSAGCIQ